MLVRIQNAWDAIRTSLWFFPGGIALTGALLAWAALTVPFNFGDNVWWLYGGSIEAASNLLSSFLNSLITVATLAISITMVVLTLAAQQLGPRLIRTFVGTLRTQIPLGIFVSAIIYLVLVLRSLPAQDGGTVPNLAVTIGTGFVILCTMSLLFFVNHLSQSIVADTMIERVGADLDAAANRLLPEKPGRAEPIDLIERTAKEATAGFGLDLGGYVQAIDYEAIVRAACEADAVIHLHLRPGRFLIPGGGHVTMLKGRPSDALKVAVEQAVNVGQQRTTPQDLEYSVRQLVEIAMRGLKVWDVYTCTHVLDRLVLSLAAIMRKGERQRLWRDKDGELRLLAESVTFEGLADEAFNQIRQGGECYPAVLIHLADSLDMLFELAPTDRHRAVIARHSRLVAEQGRRSIPEPADIAVLEQRAARASGFASGRDAAAGVIR